MDNERTQNPQQWRVRSFVRRSGRITKRQQAAYQRLPDFFGIKPGTERLSLASSFGREAPLTLEIGFGMGESTAAIAERYPEKNYLAIEVHPAGIGNLVALLEEKKLSNVRIIEHDAIEVLENAIPDSTLSAIHIYFPDPWPKKRHRKRRLIKPKTACLFCQKLKLGGYIHVATDWQEYAEEILAIFENESQLSNTATGFAKRPAWRPQTKFEQKAERADRHSFDIIFERQ